MDNQILKKLIHLVLLIPAHQISDWSVLKFQREASFYQGQLNQTGNCRN